MSASEPSARLDDDYARTEARLRELTSAFAAVVESADAANLDDDHDPEGPTIGFERAQLAALLEQARSRLLELDAARLRLQLGAYGVCETCGGAIPTSRLVAQPATRNCVACASHDGARRRRR